MATRSTSELLLAIETLQADVIALVPLVGETEFKTLQGNILSTMSDIVESLTTGMRMYVYAENDSVSAEERTPLTLSGNTTIDHLFGIQVFQVIVFEETSEGFNPSYCSFTMVDGDRLVIHWFGPDLDVNEIYLLGQLL